MHTRSILQEQTEELRLKQKELVRLQELKENLLSTLFATDSQQEPIIRACAVL